MGNRMRNLRCLLGLCGLVLLFAQGCEELPKLDGWYFELEPVFQTYHVNENCIHDPKDPFDADDWPTGQPPQVAPFGARLAQVGGNLGGMFMPPYPFWPAFNVHGTNQGGVIWINIQDSNAPKFFDLGFMTGYSITFNGTAVDEDGDDVADAVVLDPNKDNTHPCIRSIRRLHSLCGHELFTELSVEEPRVGRNRHGICKLPPALGHCLFCW